MMKELARNYAGWIVFVFSIVWTAGVAYGTLKARDYIQDVMSEHNRQQLAQFQEIRNLLWDLKKERKPNR